MGIVWLFVESALSLLDTFLGLGLNFFFFLPIEGTIKEIVLVANNTKLFTRCRHSWVRCLNAYPHPPTLYITARLFEATSDRCTFIYTNVTLIYTCTTYTRTRPRDILCALIRILEYNRCQSVYCIL